MKARVYKSGKRNLWRSIIHIFSSIVLLSTLFLYTGSNANARYYDPRLGRWISVDKALPHYFPDRRNPKHNSADFDPKIDLPGMGGIYSPFNLNVYHYSFLNPIRFTDPDGNEVFIFGIDDTIFLPRPFVEALKISDDTINIPLARPSTGVVTQVTPNDTTIAAKPTSNSKAPIKDQGYIDNKGKEYKYEPPKNWNGKPDKQGNYPTKNGDKWSPITTHRDTHAPHHDIQHPDGSHTAVYPKPRTNGK